MVHIFLGHHRVTELNHTLFAFGHLNAIKYFKCPNNPKLKCSMLVISYIVDMSSLVIFVSVQVFFNKAKTIAENRKQKVLEKRERRKLTWRSPGSPAGPTLQLRPNPPGR